MKSANRIWAALAVVLLASSAMSQDGRVTDPTRPGGKVKPVDTSYPLCFGDGSGVNCPFKNFGDRGHGCDNSVGAGGGLLWARGVADVDNDSLRFFVQGVPSETLVMYVQGRLPVDGGMGRTFGDGLMCVSGPIVKLGSASAWKGRSAFPPLGSKATISQLGEIGFRGGTRYYQAFYRDQSVFGAGSGPVFNSTNAWCEVWMP